MNEPSFSEQRTNLPTGPLFFLKGGDGRPLLHLHSSAGPRLSPVIEYLSRRHVVYMPTVPGFNGTPLHRDIASMADLSDLMAEFMRTTIGGSCDVMAESFGGWIALWLAARHPALVEQLVLEAPAGLRVEGTGGLPADPAQRLSKLHAVLERAPKEMRSGKMLADNQRVRDNYAGGASFDVALNDALSQITARTLILFGTQDEVVPIDTGRRLQAGIGKSHLTFVYGAAHAVEFDQPGRVGRLASAFLERGEAFLVRNPQPATA
jgi:pimeloyl-ACP methyl ester carboxylesterase